MLNFDTLVIGGNINAVVYAYIHNLPIIINHQDPPNKFEFFPVGYDLRELPFLPHLTSAEVFGGETRHYGNEKFEVWGRLLYCMSLGGLVPFHNKNTKILVDKNDLEVSLETKTLINKFNQLIVFDDRNLVGLPTPHKKNEENRKVVDWFEIQRRIAKKIIDYDIVPFGEHEAYLFLSRRAMKHTKRTEAKDAVVLSELTAEEVEFDEVPPIVVKLSLEEKLKELTGEKKVEAKHAARVVEYKMDLYHDTDNIKFNYQSLDEIINSATNLKSYSHTLAKHFRFYELDR